MHILVTGGTGLIGQVLVAELLQRGDQVTLLSRNFKKSRDLYDGQVSLLGSVRNSGLKVDAVINLAGEPIADKRWSRRRKRKLKQSRIGVTEDIIAWLRTCEHKPEAFISGSAIGYYGNYPESLQLNETAAPRQGFASELCREWEATARLAEPLGVRVCLVRTAVVLAKQGGALKKMWLPFSLGLGGPIASGNQWFSWIHLQDMVKLLLFLIDNPSVSGPVNAAAPYPVTNNDFSRQFARALHRPVFCRVPAIALVLAMGESAELLLGGQRVVPKKLLDKGFVFDYPQLGQALTDVVTRR